MSRTLSKLFIRINIGIFAINFVVLFIASILGLSATGNMILYLVPGMAIVGLIVLVYPEFFNAIAGMFGWQSVTNPTSDQVFQQISKLFDNAFSKDYDYLQSNGIPTATFCAIMCWVVGIICLFEQAKLLRIAQSPMDWYKKKAFSTYFYTVFGLIYGITLCVGSMSIVFAKQSVTGGLLTLGWFLVICALLVIAGVAVILIERFVTVQAYNAMSMDEQIVLCEKQAKYMNKRQRKRQVKKLGENARVKKDEPTDTPTDTADTEKPKKKKKKKGAKPSSVTKPTVAPTQSSTPPTVAPTEPTADVSQEPPVDYVPTDIPVEKPTRKGKKKKGQVEQPIEQPAVSPTEQPTEKPKKKGRKKADQPIEQPQQTDEQPTPTDENPTTPPQQ